MTIKQTLLLIDADVLLWRASQGAQRTFDFGKVFATGADYGRARDTLDGEIRDLIVKLKATKILLCLSDPRRNWRKELWGKVYKANRPSAKPKVFWQLREHAESTYPFRWYPGLEGDDVLGLYMTSPMLADTNRIMVSIDKDMQTVPGRLYNPGHPERGVRVINEYEADQYHLIQTLTGDAVDGYKGCPGIGEKRAWAALFNLPHHAQWKTVVRLFAQKGLGEDIALLNARVAHIMRYGDYNKETYQVKLWEPPSTPSEIPANAKSSTPAPSATPATAKAASTSSRRSSSKGSPGTSRTEPASTATTTGSEASPSAASTTPPSATSSRRSRASKTKTT